MSRRDDIKQKALRAAVAVTMSASFATGCAEDTTDTGDGGWNVDAAADASGEDVVDTTDEDGMDTGDTSVADADTGPSCSGTADDVCPDRCSVTNDADCCEESGGFWDSSGACAVPGPFVPPAMRA